VNRAEFSRGHGLQTEKALKPTTWECARLPGAWQSAAFVHHHAAMRLCQFRRLGIQCDCEARPPWLRQANSVRRLDTAAPFHKSVFQPQKTTTRSPPL